MPGKNGCLLNTNDANTSQDWEGTTSARKCVEEGSCQCPRQEAVTQVVTQTRTGGSPGPGARERQVPTPCDSSQLDSVRGGQTSAVARGRKARLPPGWLLLDGGTGSYPGSRRRWGRRGTGVRGGEGRPSQTVGGGVPGDRDRRPGRPLLGALAPSRGQVRAWAHGVLGVRGGVLARLQGRVCLGSSQHPLSSRPTDPSGPGSPSRNRPGAHPSCCFSGTSDGPGALGKAL